MVDHEANYQQKVKNIESSSKTFKKVSEPDTGKFNKLPYWLKKVAYRYEKEFDNDFPTKYYHYKRGTVIRVDFGVNMGSEFCGIHFAIVLDKKDNARKRTLTVVPLTSKEKAGRFPLGKEVFNQTISILTLRVKELKEKTTQLLKKNNDNPIESRVEYDSINQELDQLAYVVDIYKEFDKASYVRTSDITTISKFRIKRINKYDPSGKIQLNSVQMTEISNKLMELYIKE
ncbi:type II toxin-antitoxin system PemK/MazF family toxin [Latilactobacillus sp. 5-91]|uniref:type II toxin-antitoxin system PemK/MazF family toxin n=1 Tax=Latilactobacillus sp. 5-91 TaxID=3410924 RepID=UPI003C734EF4